MITINSVTKNVSEVFQLDISEITRNIQTKQNEDNEYYVTGDGIFDNLMETATAHLDAQWNNQRIRGEQYAEVYEQIYIKTLELALNAWINKPKADAETLLTLDNIDKVNAETANIQEQTVHEKLKEELTKCQTKLTCEQYQHELLKENLTEAQTANTAQDTKVKICQERLVCAQADHEVTKEELTEAQTENVEKDTEVKDCQRKLTCEQAEHEKIKEAVTEQQVNDVIASTELKGAQSYLAKCQADGVIADIAVKQKQLELIASQVKSEDQKLEVYKAQAQALNDDIKYKLLKLSLDTWGLGFSVASSSIQDVPIMMTGTASTAMAAKLLADRYGINVNMDSHGSTTGTTIDGKTVDTSKYVFDD